MSHILTLALSLSMNIASICQMFVPTQQAILRKPIVETVENATENGFDVLAEDVFTRIRRNTDKISDSAKTEKDEILQNKKHSWEHEQKDDATKKPIRNLLNPRKLYKTSNH